MTESAEELAYQPKPDPDPNDDAGPTEKPKPRGFPSGRLDKSEIRIGPFVRGSWSFARRARRI
jgi:hypothetical protein